MNKRFVWTLSILTLLAVTLGVTYYYFFSLSSVLRASDFSMEDIITTKDYPMDSDDQYQLLLLSNEEQLGLIVAKKNRYGLWTTLSTPSITDNLSGGNFAVGSHALMDLSDGKVNSQTTVFLASYTDKLIPADNFSAEGFKLNIENFDVNDRNLLFVEAIAASDKESFGSDEVVHYLQDEFDILK